MRSVILGSLVCFLFFVGKCDSVLADVAPIDLGGMYRAQIEILINQSSSTEHKSNNFGRKNSLS